MAYSFAESMLIPAPKSHNALGMVFSLMVQGIVNVPLSSNFYGTYNYKTEETALVEWTFSANFQLLVKNSFKNLA